MAAEVISFAARCHQYTDDTQVYLSIASESKEAVKALEWCLNEVVDWMRASKLCLNPEKTEVIWVGDSYAWETGMLPVLDRVILSLKKIYSLE